MLCNPVEALQSEAQTTKHFLVRQCGIKHTSVLFFRNVKVQEKTTEHGSEMTSGNNILCCLTDPLIFCIIFTESQKAV